MAPSVEIAADIAASGLAWLIPGSVLLSSLVGSAHCVAMCGPLVLSLASTPASANSKAASSRLISFHLGRMASYTALGAIAGTFGEKALRSSLSPWLTALSLIFISSTLIYMGACAFRGRSSHIRLPKPVAHFLSRLLSYIWKKVLTQPRATQTQTTQPRPSSEASPDQRQQPIHSALFISGLSGFLTVFMPCGHLYGFAAGAMAIGSAWGGALFMFAFWLGTVPALAFGARLLRSFLQPGLSRSPRLAGSLLMIAGLLSVSAFAAHLQPHLDQWYSAWRGHGPHHSLSDLQTTPHSSDLASKSLHSDGFTNHRSTRSEFRQLESGSEGLHQVKGPRCH